MEIGLWKMKKHQSIVARPSPALGVLFWAAFDNASVQIDVIVYNFLMYFCSFARLWAKGWGGYPQHHRWALEWSSPRGCDMPHGHVAAQGKKWSDGRVTAAQLSPNDQTWICNLILVWWIIIIIAIYPDCRAYTTCSDIPKYHIPTGLFHDIPIKCSVL